MKRDARIETECDASLSKGGRERQRDRDAIRRLAIETASDDDGTLVMRPIGDEGNAVETGMH